MATYAQYRESVGIDNKTMTETLSKRFPNYSKIQSAMINAPEKYGVCLTKEAELHLAEVHGYGSGLSVKPKKKREVKRNKSNRMAVRLDDKTYDTVKAKMAEMGIVSVQAFLETAIENMTKE